jgi:hypothetical protein
MGCLQAEKEKKIVTDEREKLKKNVTKLLSRKGKFDNDLKQCGKC